MKFTHILTAAALVLLSACSNSTPEPTHGHLPGNDDDDPTTDTYDFTPELSDDATRFTSSQFTINYNDAGVIACLDNDKHTYSLIDLGNDNRIDLTAKQLKQGILDAQLSLNGIPCEECEIKGELLTSDAIWISIKFDDKNRAVLVLNKNN